MLKPFAIISLLFYFVSAPAMDLTKIGTVVGRNATMDGPNCFNATLFGLGLVEGIRHSPRTELEVWLKSSFCKPISPSHTKAGDIAIYHLQFPGLAPSLEHSSLKVSDRHYFQKLDLGMYTRYEYVPESAIDDVYLKSWDHAAPLKSYHRCSLREFTREVVAHPAANLIRELSQNLSVELVQGASTLQEKYHDRIFAYFAPQKWERIISLSEKLNSIALKADLSDEFTRTYLLANLLGVRAHLGWILNSNCNQAMVSLFTAIDLNLASACGGFGLACENASESVSSGNNECSNRLFPGGVLRVDYTRGSSPSGH